MVFVAVLAHAQTSRGALTGTVLDDSGARVPGAALVLTGVNTGVRLASRTNAAGVYRFDGVDPGLYNLAVTHTGFKTFVAAKIAVEANRAATIDAKLEVGDTSTQIEVNAESSELLARDGPLRGGNFQFARRREDLPLISLDPLSLARTLPGATEAFGSTVWSGGYASNGVAASAVNSDGAGFAINGQRTRGNNYLLDGTESNEVWISGEEQIFTIADAVEEVSVQTGLFGVEFGRAGGGVFNIITKSGTNALHGTLLWRYQSERFDSVSNLTKLNGLPQSVFSNNVFGFTAGGPIRKNETFFFAGFEQNDTHSTASYGFQVPTAAAVSQLISLFPGNPRLALYLNALGDFRGTANLFPIQLGNDPVSGVNRGPVQFGTAAYVLPSINDGPQWLVRIDHIASTRQHLSARLTFDSRQLLPDAVSFPGFVQQDSFQHVNLLFSHTYVFNPAYTNELRLSYERPDANLDQTWPGSSPAAFSFPLIQIANISAPGVASANANFHRANDFILQETQTKLRGRHAFRYGVDFLRQLIQEQRAANDLGSISYTNSPGSPGYSAFANFLDDFSGPSGTATRVFGAPVFYPNQFHQSYFFEDQWKATRTLAMTLGLRYENFGQFANSLPYPAFSGFDSSQFLIRHSVSPDNRDFGPAFGLAWSPGGKTVWRGGYQISYDSPPTQLIALGPATTSPNAITTTASIAAPEYPARPFPTGSQAATRVGQCARLDGYAESTRG